LSNTKAIKSFVEAAKTDLKSADLSKIPKKYLYNFSISDFYVCLHTKT
jgi:hypothetical protein